MMQFFAYFPIEELKKKLAPLLAGLLLLELDAWGAISFCSAHEVVNVTKIPVYNVSNSSEEMKSFRCSRTSGNVGSATMHGRRYGNSVSG